MMRRAHPTRVGLFAIGAVALLVAAVVVVSGGRLFASQERAVMHFEGSIYGLQLGAPVVFRGVRLGSVRDIGVVHDGTAGGFSIPVVVELDRSLIRNIQGRPSGATLQALVDQGLYAQLSMQSLLTGLLYVDLDLGPKAAAGKGPPSKVGDGLTEIPTRTTTIQNLQKQIQGLDVAGLVNDVSSIAASARRLIGDPKVQQALEDLSAASGDLRRTLTRLDGRLDSLTAAVQGTLAESRQTITAWGGAAERVGRAVDRAASAVERTDALLAQGTPVLQSVQRAAEELARAATALRGSVGDDSALLGQVQRAAQDVSRASRAVRDLADLLERQPESLLRGRGASNP